MPAPDESASLAALIHLPNELTLPAKQRQHWPMKLLATSLLGVPAGMMISLQPTGCGNP
jgi:hypothetical protein